MKLEKNEKNEITDLREHLVWLLDCKSAHADFAAAVAGLPEKLRGALAAGIPHSAWQMLEHLRIAQADILDYCRDAKRHVSPRWPDGFWPRTPAPPTRAAWSTSVKAFRADLKAMKSLLMKPSTDLFAPLPDASGVTLLTEALLLADHNAYHIGQLVLLRRALGAWSG